MKSLVSPDYKKYFQVLVNAWAEMLRLSMERLPLLAAKAYQRSIEVPVAGLGR